MPGETRREGGTGVLDKQWEELKEPPLWRVILHNDDYTPMDFVVAVLVQVFHHPHAAANRIMLDVHTKGRAVAGVFSHEVAETKQMQALKHAERHGHPFEVSIEPEAR